MIVADVAHDATQMPARQSVVADVGDTVGSQILGADAENGLLHRPRHPAEDTVADDVVELGPANAQITNIAVPDLDILQSELRNCTPSVLDLTQRQVDADEASMRVSHRERNDVAAGRATELQDARLVRGRRR